MDIAQLKADLIREQGKRLTVYKDRLGYLTVGVGHLVVPSDKLNEGQHISELRCDDFLEEDLSIAIAGAEKAVPAFHILPDSVQHLLVCLCFTLGYTYMCKFKKFIASVNIQDFRTAAKEIYSFGFRHYSSVLLKQ